MYGPQGMGLYQWTGPYLYSVIKVRGTATLKKREAACTPDFEKEQDRYSRLKYQICEYEGVDEGEEPHQLESESKSKTHLPSMTRCNCFSVEKDAEALSNKQTYCA